MTSARAMLAHPDYKAAKAGDMDAAARLVAALAKPLKLRAVALRHPKAMVVPVHAEERSGRNQIPSKFADYFAYTTGLALDTGIAQSAKTGHTGANF